MSRETITTPDGFIDGNPALLVEGGVTFDADGNLRVCLGDAGFNLHFTPTEAVVFATTLVRAATHGAAIAERAKKENG